MEGDSDVLVEDGYIMASTEINDVVQETVDPTIFALDDDIISPEPLEHQATTFTNEIIQASARSPAGGLSPEMPDTSRSSTESSESTDLDMEMTMPSQQAIVQVLIPRRRFEPLPYSSTQTGLVYDVRMRFHTDPPSSTISEDDIHPEDPRRIFSIYQALVDAGLVQDDDDDSTDFEPDFRLYRVEARNANAAEICLIHTKEHFLWVKNLRNKSEEELRMMALEGDSIYLHKLTFDCALLAAGGAIEACRAVVAGHVKNAFAVIRPPGHHAERDSPGGFCFFNNVPIAARVCQKDYPQLCRKILILDWDVHHGNGVQNAFYDDPNILYISLHVHRNGTFYPFGTKGDHRHCGDGPGLGRNVNIPWADIGMGDGDYMFAFQQVVMPIATEFDPDLVIISAGFDAAEGDLLGGCHVSPPCYAHMTHMLMSLACGKIAVCLEGGYDLSATAKSSLAVTRTLMGEPPDRLLDLEPSALGVSTVQLVKTEQSRYWKCMYPKNDAKTFGDGLKTERLHDVIRAWQSKVLFDEYHMTTLEIYRERVSKSFEDQVLATTNYAEARSLLVVIRDPPVVQGISDPKTAKLDLHKYWLVGETPYKRILARLSADCWQIWKTDASKPYIDWAVKHAFGVVDVNIPKHITDPEDVGGPDLQDDPEARIEGTRELVVYLWENYIELSDADNVFLLGIGAAYDAIVDLLCTQDGCESRISHIFGFVAGNALHGVKHPTDDRLARWYSDHSHIFVDNDHLAWDPVRTRKLRRKYGKLIRSPKTDLNEMLAEHYNTITNLMWTQADESRREPEEQESKREGTDPGKFGSQADLSSNVRVTPQPQFGFSGGEAEREFRLNNVSAFLGSNSPGLDRNGTKSPVKLPPLGYFNVSPSRRDGRDRTGSPRSPNMQQF